MDYPIASTVEQAINNQVNALVGNQDTNLNTIVKMSMMNDIYKVPDGEMKEILNRIASGNKMETYFIDKEYELTMDMSGNLIPINNIVNGKEGEHQTDIKSVIFEPE